MKMCLGSMKFQVTEINALIVFHGLDFLHSHLLEALPVTRLTQAAKTNTNIMIQLCMAVLQTSGIPFFILQIFVKICKIRHSYFDEVLMNET